MHTVETSLCMGIMLIAIMQFILAGFNLEQKVSNYVEKQIKTCEMQYGKDDNVKKDYAPSEFIKCISIIENIGGENYGD